MSTDDGSPTPGPAGPTSNGSDEPGSPGSGQGEQAGKNGTDDDRKLLATAGTEARRNSFGPGGGVGIPTERSENFGVTLKRLGEILGKERPLLMGVVVATVISVCLVVIGPRLLGDATNIIVDGVRSPDGIDFDALHRQLFIVAGVYLASWVLSYTQAYVLAGVVQRSMYALREAVERKLNHLPLSYIDRQPRGDLLSRVTNDIDNLSQSLQQTISQILTSLLTLLGVAVMMFTISPLLALVALITVPISVFLMKLIGGKARPRFMAQWRHTGDLNARPRRCSPGIRS
jgi:ATP-binding cassette, subfamily B, multidrug efflux pump